MTTPDLLERMAEALRTADKCMTYFGSEPERCDDEEAAAWLQIREALAAYDARGAQGEELVKFLCGEGPLDGVWFGESHPTERGDYWWRKYVRARLPKEAE